MSARPVETWERWYACVPCDVSWRDTVTTCWSCGSGANVVPHYPNVSKDQMRPNEPVEGTALSRFGTRGNA